MIALTTRPCDQHSEVYNNGLFRARPDAPPKVDSVAQ